MKKRSPLVGRTFLCGVAVASAAALDPALARAQQMPQRASPFGAAAGGEAGRAFIFSSPVVNMNGETLAHFEFNLGGKATLTVEGGVQRKLQMVDEKETAKTGEKLTTEARGAALIISRFTEPMQMAGFYWSLGVGYREQTTNWTVKPDQSDVQIDFSLIDDPDQTQNHSTKMAGTTGHGRVGYRYVGAEFPVVAGVYLGLRHFQATVRDETRKVDDSPDAPQYAPTTGAEQDHLKRIFETRPECGIEIGVAF